MTGMGPVFVLVAIGVVICVACLASAAVQANARQRARWRIRLSGFVVRVLDDDAPALEGSRR